MKPRDPMTVALLFNVEINNQNIEGISSLMADDYTFIDTDNNVETGKQKGIRSWAEFFSLFPDYRNIFDIVMSKGELVIMIGHSTCSDKHLDGPAIWTAKVDNNMLREWRVYEDTDENRKLLGIDDIFESFSAYSPNKH